MTKSSTIRVILFALLGAILLQFFSYAFRGGYWFEKNCIYDRTARLAAFDNETPGQIEVLNLGDSLSICALIPPELFREYGITAYNLGQDMQFPVESYHALKHAVETQPIKVVLLETNGLFYENTLVDEGIKTLSEFLQSTFPFLRYHNLWKMLFKHKNIRTYFKGYTINDVTNDFTFDEEYNYHNDEFFPVEPQQYLQLKRICSLCERNGIKLILYSSASIRNYYTMRKRNTLLKICSENHLDFVDANYDIGLVGIDWNTDTWDDGDHLNLSGARKMTTYLGNYLSTNCKALTDHRGDPSYHSWDEMLKVYDEEVVKMKGTNYSILESELGF